MYNFNLDFSENIEEISSVGYVYTHRCGARLIFIKNDDKNRVYTVAFNTLPKNDKGIPHITEHSVLCGSEKYRMKDPFNILDKGSIHTYLNAVTYPDKTIYPVAGTNLTDFETMVRVYTDGVFKPLIYENEGIFRQEGWNSDGKALNGIVLNEMKGVFSSPDIILKNSLRKELFKGTDYVNYSGGNPDNIPELTYEEFLEFHKKYYHGSNAVFYFYGDLDIEKYMKFLDEEYLKDFEKRENMFSTDFELQPSNDVVVKTDKKGDNILQVLYTYGNVLDYKKCLFADIIIDAMCNAEDAPMKEAVVNAGLGTMVMGINDDSVYLPYAEITVKGSKETDLAKFKETVEKCWFDIAEKGIDSHKLQSIINSYKFYTMEKDFGYKPVGLFYGLLLQRSFMYGNDSFQPLRLSAMFDEIEKADVKEFVKKYFVGKGCFGLLIAGEGEEKPQIAVPKANNQPLIDYQKTEDLPSEINKIHIVQPSEIDKTALYIPYEANENGIFTPVRSKEIVYADLMFDTSSLTDYEKKTLALYDYIVNVYDKDTATDIDFYTGGFSVYFTTIKKKDDFKPVVVFKIKALRENIYKSLDLFRKVIGQKYTDLQRLKNLMDEYRQDIYETYEESGNTVAYRTCLGQISEAYAYEYAVKGIDCYRYVCDTSDVARTAAEMENIANKLFTQANMYYAVTAGESDKNNVVSYIEGIKADLPTGEKQERTVISPCCKSIAYGVNTDVSYNAAACIYEKSDGILKVAKRIISSEYLWDNVRLKGGAYGGDCGFLNGKYFYMYSYRDPNIENTFDVFKNAGEYLSRIALTKDDLNRFIIGAVNVEDKPLKDNMINGIALRRHYNKNTMELLNRRREEMLGATAEGIRKIGEELTESIKNAVISTVSSRDKIEKTNIFENIVDVEN